MIELSRYVLEALRKDEEFILYRGRSQDGASSGSSQDAVTPFDHDPASVGLSQVLVAAPVLEYPRPQSLKLLEHGYSFKEELERAWAARPIAIARHWNRIVLVMEDPGGVPLDQLLGQPLDIELSLRLAVSLSSAISRLHQRGIVHKDIKPAHILADSETGQCWLRGFGVASRLKRERQAPEPPEFIEGTLAYMAPEQTGRMNRSIDSRSDLYSFGVTLYEMVTGELPFTASDPMEWVHCHIAKQPISPEERLSSVPAPVSAIIMKLLTKTAEERYQTAAGVSSDLRRCLDEYLRSSGVTGVQETIPVFPLGQHDTPDQLLIPEKLYGRTREIDNLLASFERVAASGTPELVLVSGYSGIGKSSVVNELHKVLVLRRGLFASGKFDQFKRDIPYATLAEAFQSVVRQLLTKSEADLNDWREAFQEALGPNGQLMVDLVPELKLIIGEQAPLPDLPSQDAQRRFQTVFQRFIGVFARPEHPLVLFLDDLQWLDATTLDLLEELFTSDFSDQPRQKAEELENESLQSRQSVAGVGLGRTLRPDVRHLMLIGAYRDNEVSSAHPLMRKLAAIRDSGAVVREIILTPLTEGDLRQLISDSLHSRAEPTVSLAQLVHEKTAGNPFFAIQFISALADEGLLTFDHNALQWAWDLDRIHAKGYTDNVVDLLVEKLNRLSAKTQEALQLFACIGNSAEDILLETAYEGLGKDLHDVLWEAIQAGLIFRSEGAYRFLHDRVQEAAYSLIPEVARSRTHLQIGRLLASRTEPAEIEGRVFEIVNQLNRGSQLIASPDERTRVAGLNLIAGRRARLSAAYASAIEYLTAGRALLTEEHWEHNYELIFGIESQLAECELLTASMAAAEQRLSMLAGRAEKVQDIAAVARLRLTLCTTLDQMDRGVEVCLEYLRRGSTDWSPHPTPDQAQREYDRTWIKLGSRPIESIVDLPLMTDPEALAEIEVLTEIVTPAEFTDENLLLLVICRMVNLSLEHGNSDGSCFAYVYLGMIAGERFGSYGVGVRFGQLGYDLVEKRGLRRFQARTYLSLADLVTPWTSHVRTARDLIRRAFDTADRIGDLTFAAYSCFSLNTNLLATGDPLVDTHREAQNSLEFAQRTRFGLAVDTITAQLCLIRTLRGLTPEFGCFNDAQFNELHFERRLANDPRLAFAECRYWVRKLQARFLAADYTSAIEASANAQRLLWTSRFTLFVGVEYEFYSALTHAAVWDSATAGEREDHFNAVTAHCKQLEVRADNCPENFLTRVALVRAEIARIEGRDLDAMRFYEQAIRCARENDFIHIEGVANEVAARFYSARGFETIAHAYLLNARYCFLRWEAHGKVRQLDDLLPHLREEEALPRPTPVRQSRFEEMEARVISGGGGSTIGASVEQLDLATVIKVSQTVSTEIVLEKLIDTLMRMAIEHAGAERGLLILPREGELGITAEATISGDSVIVRLREAPARTGPAPADPAFTAEAEAPESLIHYVFRTQETVILDDATTHNPFSADSYLRRNHARSILCLPLINQAKLIGVLYLENNLTPHVFTPTRIAVLKVLASQAAISLENTRLYRDLEKREAKIRRLVDANIMGIFMGNFEGQVIEANDAFLRMVNYSREDLVSGRLNWKDLTPPEWRDLTEQALSQLKATGILQPYEKEYYRNDGSRIPVLVGSAVFEEGQNEGVSFVLDLTELKRAEEALRSSQAHLAEAQAELAQVTRLTALGELTASIAHEINQPLAGMLTNANASLRWLAGESPNLDEARDAIRRIVRDGSRAGNVITRVRALFKKAAAAKERVDINEMIQEVLAVTQNELQRNGISLRTEFANDLPMVIGDKVQLQQVVLNLVVNSIEAMSGVSEGSRELCVSSQKSVGIFGATGQEPFNSLDRSQVRTSGSSSLPQLSVLVAVRDSGPGLDSAQLQRVFETYYTTKSQGMGMGLAISRSIIEAHGGQLWAKTNTPRGALFEFTLPVHEPAGMQ